MARQYKQLPNHADLEPTLARRVNQIREFRNLTVRDLAELTHLGIRRIEDIEGGLETWLSTTDRQVLAKVLALEPYLLQEVEARQSGDSGDVRLATELRLVEQIMEGAKTLPCPNCGGTLKCSVQDALDIKGYATCFPKAYCTKCVFVLT